jgi:hypothetical protein
LSRHLLWRTIAELGSQKHASTDETSESSAHRPRDPFFLSRSKVHLRSLITVLAMLLLLASCDSPALVDRVEISNETEYTADVDVRGETGGWLGLTTVRAHDTNEVRQVIDQGSSWTFSFKYGNHDPLDLTITKEELINADWRVEVPNEFEDRLRAKGVPPPP